MKLRELPRPFQLTLIGLIWVVAYLDWLEPGWLKFGVPASLEQPFTVTRRYDLVCETREAAVDQVVPGWAQFWEWDLRFWKQDKEPKDPCDRIPTGQDSEQSEEEGL